MEKSKLTYRELDSKEEKEFRQWARENYNPGDPINSTWHPVVKDECQKINKEKGTKARPSKCTEEHLEYLDDLRESGATNMFEARPYLQHEFPELSKSEAKEILVYWMKNFES